MRRGREWEGGRGTERVCRKNPKIHPCSFELSHCTFPHNVPSLSIPDDCDMPRPLTIATSVNHYGGNIVKPAGEKHKPGPPFPSQLLGSAAGEASGSSSIGNLLMNIQGLLKVAVENARHHEQQTNYEKGNFTMLMH